MALAKQQVTERMPHLLSRNINLKASYLNRQKKGTLCLYKITTKFIIEEKLIVLRRDLIHLLIRLITFLKNTTELSMFL